MTHIPRDPRRINRNDDDEEYDPELATMDANRRHSRSADRSREETNLTYPTSHSFSTNITWVAYGDSILEQETMVKDAIARAIRSAQHRIQEHKYTRVWNLNNPNEQRRLCWETTDSYSIKPLN